MSYLRYFSQANGQPNRVKCSITLLCNRVHAVCVPACDFALHAAASLQNAISIASLANHSTPRHYYYQRSMLFVWSGGNERWERGPWDDSFHFSHLPFPAVADGWILRLLRRVGQGPPGLDGVLESPSSWRTHGWLWPHAIHGSIGS